MEIGFAVTNVAETDAKAIAALINILVEENFRENDGLKILQGLKLIYSKCAVTVESQLLNYFDMEFLFNTVISGDKSAVKCSDELMLEYGNFLLRLINYEEKLHEGIKRELNWLINELNAKEQLIANTFIKNVWNTLEMNLIFWPSVVNNLLPMSKAFIEETVLEWITDSNALNKNQRIRYFAEICANHKSFFLLVVCILNQLVILTKGNKKVLGIVEYFISAVSNYCDENLFDFYPRKYCQIISLMMVPPDILADNIFQKTKGTSLKTKILDLLLSNFRKNKNMILLLLTHYPKWLYEFSSYLRCQDNS